MSAQWQRQPTPLDDPPRFFRGLAVGLLLSAGIWGGVVFVAANRALALALLQAAAFPAAGALIALALLWIERALWGCDADDYLDLDDEPDTT